MIDFAGIINWITKNLVVAAWIAAIVLIVVCAVSIAVGLTLMAIGWGHGNVWHLTVGGLFIVFGIGLGAYSGFKFLRS